MSLNKLFCKLLLVFNLVMQHTADLQHKLCAAPSIVYISGVRIDRKVLRDALISPHENDRTFNLRCTYLVYAVIILTCRTL